MNFGVLFLCVGAAGIFFCGSAAVAKILELFFPKEVEKLFQLLGIEEEEE